MSMPASRIITVSRLLLIVTVAVVTALSLAPIRIDGPGGTDKLGHLAAYTALSFFAVFSLRRGGNVARRSVTVIVLAAAYGILMEVIQHFVGRDFDLLDMAANTAGAALGTAVGTGLRRIVLGSRSRARPAAERQGDRRHGMLKDQEEAESR